MKGVHVPLYCAVVINANSSEDSCPYLLPLSGAYLEELIQTQLNFKSQEASVALRCLRADSLETGAEPILRSCWELMPDHPSESASSSSYSGLLHHNYCLTSVEEGGIDGTGSNCYLVQFVVENDSSYSSSSSMGNLMNNILLNRQIETSDMAVHAKLCKWRGCRRFTGGSSGVENELCSHHQSLRAYLERHALSGELSEHLTKETTNISRKERGTSSLNSTDRLADLRSGSLSKSLRSYLKRRVEKTRFAALLQQLPIRLAPSWSQWKNEAAYMRCYILEIH